MPRDPQQNKRIFWQLVELHVHIHVERQSPKTRSCNCLYFVYIFSGGTMVTVTGSNLDSVAVPLINLTVLITRWTNGTASYSPFISISEVLGVCLINCYALTSQKIDVNGNVQQAEINIICSDPSIQCIVIVNFSKLHNFCYIDSGLTLRRKSVCRRFRQINI